MFGKQRLMRRAELPGYVSEKHGVALSTQTYAKLAVVGGGPPFRKSGRWPLYDPDDVDEWALSRLSKKVRSTSELPAARASADLQPEAA